MAEFFKHTWKWLIAGAAVIISAVFMLWAGSSRKNSDIDGAVDAAKADDAVRSAIKQADAARQKAVELAVKSATASDTINKERASIASGVDTSEIDRILTDHGILKP